MSFLPTLLGLVDSDFTDRNMTQTDKSELEFHSLDKTQRNKLH